MCKTTKYRSVERQQSPVYNKSWFIIPWVVDIDIAINQCWNFTIKLKNKNPNYDTHNL